MTFMLKIKLLKIRLENVSNIYGNLDMLTGYQLRSEKIIRISSLLLLINLSQVRLDDRQFLINYIVKNGIMKVIKKVNAH